MKKIIYLSFNIAVFVLTSCSSENENKDLAQLSFKEKVANLEAALEAKAELSETEREQIASLNQLVLNKSQEPFITTAPANKSFDFDDLGADRVEFNAITQPPFYSSCENTDMEVQRACVEEAVAAYVTSHFNTEVYKTSKVRGRYEMTASFLIDTEGKIQDVKIRNDYDKALSAEAKRVLKDLPQMQPGKHKGKPMAALFTLPIVYDLKS